MAETAGALPGVRRALVIGVGRSGLAAVRALAAAGCTVVAVDERADAPGADEARALGADVHVGADPLDHLVDVDLVVPSPGVPETATVLRTALEAGTPVWSEPELGWRLHPRRLVAITGTNGKTSVTELTTRMLAGAGLDAVACGNIGNAFTDAAATAAADAVLVAELSSFQLRFCDALRPVVGVLLNLAPDHLDWHPSFEAYGAAKARLWQAQTDGDWAVVNHDDPTTLSLAERWAPAGRAAFSSQAVVGDDDAVAGPHVGWEGSTLVARLPEHRGAVLDAGELTIDAPHHRANVAAAACAALLAGAPIEAVANAARSFRPGRHRVEHVATIGGVDFVDDSKATNPHAAAAALHAFERIVWIAGGLAKGVDLGLLDDHLDRVRHAVAIGQAADEVVAVCAGAGVGVERASSMDDAVRAAARAAGPGDTVLLAPACASFDMFADYADRGEKFAAAVRSLATEASHGGS